MGASAGSGCRTAATWSASSTAARARLLAAPDRPDGAEDHRLPAHNRGRQPFQGDNDRLTTISPNGDGVRESAKICFTLTERARVHFEVTRTVSAPETIYELTANLRAGPEHVHLAPALDGRRAHVPRPDHGDGRRRQPPHLRRRQRAAGPQAHIRGRPRARRRRRLHARELRRARARRGSRSRPTRPSSRCRRSAPGRRKTPTYNDTLMNGVPVTQPVTIPWSARHRRATLNFAVGPWPTGRLLRQADRRRRRGSATRRSSSGRRSSATRAASRSSCRRTRGRPTTSATTTATAGATRGTRRARRAPPRSAALFLRRGVPPQYRKYDVGFLRWLHATGKQPDFLTETDLESIRTAEELIAPLRPRHLPRPHRVRHAARVRPDPELPRPRRQPRVPLGEQLLLGGPARRAASSRTRLWRDVGRPESALIGVQYRANDDGRIQRPFIVRAAATAPWLCAGTGLADGATFGQELGGYGIEIDQTTPPRRRGRSCSPRSPTSSAPASPRR